MKFLNITGYGATGQTALYDLFSEFDDYSTPPHFEFVLLKEAYGILDLENFLIDNWEILRSSIAIKDYLKFCRVLNRRGNKFFKFGYDYKNKLDKDFFKLSNEYINKLTLSQYKGTSMVNIYNKNAYSYFIEKLISIILKKPNSDKMYISQPSYKDFISETQDYLEKIFYRLSYCGTKTVVIDNAIPTSNMDKSLKYFRDIKMIVVERDARDTYYDLKQKKLLIGAEFYSKDSLDKYISWVKTNRKKTNYELTNVLKIDFEDLVLNYENTLDNIKIFLGHDIKHSKKLAYFNPEVSKKNIGIWKQYHNQKFMRQISKELPQYCKDI
tara:strand:- start:2321 stop:3298 length:978 start_codon:yes stop_codon:yes gene_type:complete